MTSLAIGTTNKSNTKWNRQVWRFFEMKPIRQRLIENEDGGLSLEMVHRDARTGERQRLTMRLDKPEE